MCWPSNRSPTRSRRKLPNNQESPILLGRMGDFVWSRGQGRPLRSSLNPPCMVGRAAASRPPYSKRSTTFPMPRKTEREARRDTPPGVSVSAPQAEGLGKNHHVIARPKAVAIRIPCGAKHRPVPRGPERERIAASAYGLLAMTALLETVNRPRRDPPPGVSVSAPQAEGPGKNHHVIARPKAVAISWKNLRIRSQ